MEHVKNKSPTRDRIDFEKQMVHYMDEIFDFIKNTCIHVLTTYLKWKAQARVRMDLVIEMTCGCDEIIS